MRVCAVRTVCQPVDTLVLHVIVSLVSVQDEASSHPCSPVGRQGKILTRSSPSLVRTMESCGYYRSDARHLSTFCPQLNHCCCDACCSQVEAMGKGTTPPVSSAGFCSHCSCAVQNPVSVAAAPSKRNMQSVWRGSKGKNPNTISGLLI